MKVFITKTPCGEVDDGQPSQFRCLAEKIYRDLKLLGVGEEFCWVHGLGKSDLTLDHPGVVHRVDHIASASLPNNNHIYTN